jgi:hypothetical protein
MTAPISEWWRDYSRRDADRRLLKGILDYAERDSEHEAAAATVAAE